MTPFGGEGAGDVWFDRLLPEWARWHGEEFKPTFDLYEKEGKYYLTAEIPGVEKDDISIDVEGRVLTVSGTKKQEKEEEGASYYFKESSYGSFSRSMRLPGEIDEESVDASFKDGVLRVVMQPKESSKTRKIEIKS